MFKKLWEWIKHPHGWALVSFYMFTAICMAGAIVFSIVGQETNFDFFAYVFYGLAAMTFGYTVYTIARIIPTIKRKITERLKSNKFTANVLENYDFKTMVFALLSFGMTIVFAIMNLASAIRYRLIWYGAIAAYYFVLILFRGGILLANKKCAKKFAENSDEYEKSKWNIYLSSGAFLILLEFAMIGAVTQMMLSERPTQSGEIMAITNATYAFYKVAMAVYNLIKSRKFNNPVTQSFRNLNFSDACMSIVSLTVMMISTFGDDNPTAALQYMKYIVGFAMCAVIVAMATFMIIRANKKINILKARGETANERRI